MKKIPLTKSALRKFLGSKKENLTALELAEMLLKYHMVMILEDSAIVVVSQIEFLSEEKITFIGGNYKVRVTDGAINCFLLIANHH